MLLIRDSNTLAIDSCPFKEVANSCLDSYIVYEPFNDGLRFVAYVKFNFN